MSCQAHALPAPSAMPLPLRTGAALALALFAGATASADITVPAASSVPPQVEARSARVLRGGEARVALRVHYGGGSAVTFEIVRQPLHGRVSGFRDLGDNRVAVTYTHDGSTSSGTDSFSYLARAGGRASAPAEVRMQVDEPPPRLVVPHEIDFGEGVAGEIVPRPLAVRNAGGGVLEGRVTVSSPWTVAPVDYRVGAGATENLALVFRPNEAKKFVGQVTCKGNAGGTATVALAGRATAPVRVDPSPVLLRREIISLTNLTDHRLPLRFLTSAHLHPINAVALPARGEAKVSIEVPPEVTGAVHENATLVGPGFVVPLPIDAPALEPAAEAVTATRVPTFSPTSTPTPRAAPSTVLSVGPAKRVPDSVADRSADALSNSLIHITTRRLDRSGWELQWPVDPGRAEATYRVEERGLSLDKDANLLTNWREVPAKVASTRGHVTAQLGRLDPHQLHMLRVTALAADGSVAWEAPLVALEPEPAQPRSGALLLLGLGGLLALFLYLRARA